MKGMKGNKPFAGDFRANLDETNADMVQFYKEMELEMDCLTLIWTKVCASLRLVSQIHMM